MDTTLIIPVFVVSGLFVYILCCIFAISFVRCRDMMEHFSVGFYIVPMYLGYYLGHSPAEWLILGVIGFFGSRLGWELFRYAALRTLGRG